MRDSLTSLPRPPRDVRPCQPRWKRGARIRRWRRAFSACLRPS